MNELTAQSAQMDRSIQGSYEFPITAWYNDLTDSLSPARSWHWHEEIQFCVIQDGPVRFSLPEKQITVQPGDGFFINRSYVHKAEPLHGSAGYICIDLNLNLMRGFAGSAIERQLYSFLDPAKIDVLVFSSGIGWQKEIVHQITEIQSDLLKGRDGVEFLITARLFRIFYEMIGNYTISPAQTKLLSSSSRDQLKTIIAYVQEHFTEKITLEQISSEVHLSQCECCRIFKKAFDSTIVSYIQECRVRKGIEILLNSSASISEAAFDLGFCSTSHFIKTFKNILGCTPGEYRSAHRGSGTH